jgi:predicted nucleotidyltransferase
MNFGLALRTLAEHGVEFVLVGGAAVVAHGSTLMTQDLDVVYRIDPANVQRLLGALSELDAYVYGDPRKLRFQASHLENRGHHLAATIAGRIDFLGAIGKNNDVVYETLAEDAVDLAVFGVRIKCISIDRLIAIKLELGRPRDLAAVVELRAIKELGG